MKKITTNNIEEKPNQIWKYIIFTYLLFWLMVLGICGTASMVFDASPISMRWLANLCAWSPTISLFILFKKLKPKDTIKSFLKKIFEQRLYFDVLIISTMAVLGCILLSILSLSFIQQKPFSSYFSLGVYSLPLSFLL